MPDSLPHLSVHQLPAQLRQWADRQPVLLDVREAWELDAAGLSLPGARLLHIPMGQLPARLGEMDPAQPVVGLCHHGMRSLQCIAFLKQRGFEHVYNLTGGIDAWSREVDASVPRY